MFKYRVGQKVQGTEFMKKAHALGSTYVVIDRAQSSRTTVYMLRDLKMPPSHRIQVAEDCLTETKEN